MTSLDKYEKDTPLTRYKKNMFPFEWINEKIHKIIIISNVHDRTVPLCVDSIYSFFKNGTLSHA